MALDLGHTRPHRARAILSKTGELLSEHAAGLKQTDARHTLMKVQRSPFEEFEKRVQRNAASLEPPMFAPDAGDIAFGDAQRLPLADAMVDLIVTSPPYAVNAIDYMRAHKFSLVWLGYSIDHLGQKRQRYIGGEAVHDITFETLPPTAVCVW